MNTAAVHFRLVLVSSFIADLKYWYAFQTNSFILFLTFDRKKRQYT